jgi:predicted porin
MPLTNVTVYGVLDTALSRDDNGSSVITRMDSGVLNGSRLGFKGTEALGNGLSVIFQIENGFTVDNGAQADATRLFNRLSYIGLSGKFGTLKLGRQNNPVYATLTSWDPFAIGMAGDSSRVFSYNGSRSDNIVSFSCEKNGFRGELQYGVGEVAGNAAANRTRAGFGGYKQGPWDLVITYQNIRNPADTASTKMALVGGNYNFVAFKFYAVYAAETGVTLGTLTKRDQRDALIGMNAPVGRNGIAIVSWIHKSDRAVAHANADQFAVGYKYALSVRTSLYGSVGELRNEANANYKVAQPGKTDKLVDLGIRHIF